MLFVRKPVNAIHPIYTFIFSVPSANRLIAWMIFPFPPLIYPRILNSKLLIWLWKVSVPIATNKNFATQLHGFLIYICRKLFKWNILHSYCPFMFWFSPQFLALMFQRTIICIKWNFPIQVPNITNTTPTIAHLFALAIVVFHRL